MKRITVFCGSSPGADEIYMQKAFELGQVLAAEKIGLVYGGAKVGLMGAVADGVLSSGGEVVGVLPRFLETKEIAHQKLNELILVESMHDRKLKMDALSDGVIALPGGYGTLEEFFEMLTWAQLGLHQKPIALLNVHGYYNTLMTLIDEMVDKGFLKDVNRKMLLIADEPLQVLSKMRNYMPPKVPKWITKKTT